MAFQTPIASTDVYKGSLFPQTIRDWNTLTDSLIIKPYSIQNSEIKTGSISELNIPGMKKTCTIKMSLIFGTSCHYVTYEPSFKDAP